MFKGHDLLETAVLASIEAGKVIMEVYDSAFEVEYKDDKSPLTEADRRANTVINQYLQRTDIPIISEENKQLDYAVRKDWETCWVVDPVDGTKEFVKRNGEFTVNIALVTDGVPGLGVIYVPVSRMLYLGNAEDKKAYSCRINEGHESLNSILAGCKPLRPREEDPDPIKVVGSRSHMNDTTKEFIELLGGTGKMTEIVSKGSSLKFCLLAVGEADIYPRFAPTMEWDTAAGHAICSALGINVISQETGEELLYNKRNLLNPWFLVFNRKRFSDLPERITS
ncbi:MAG: 3'(2'),5'-bisphosphate nucleotidase CysQ [Bacteroidia bacterium]|nr:3'(2'),5'-bisphosphate nucleotidase CysQ [Bacteroidia bacterium]